MAKLTPFGLFVWTCTVFFAGTHHDQLLEYVLYFCSLVFNSAVSQNVQTLLSGKEDSWSLFSQPKTISLFGFCRSSLPSGIVDNLESFNAQVPGSIRIIVYALCLSMAWMFRPRLLTWKPLATVEEILMFPDKSQKNLDKIVRILDNARYSLDVCVFTITNDNIEEALLKAHNRGVEVRIISDDLQMKCRGCELAKLARKGIDVKHDGNL